MMTIIPSAEFDIYAGHAEHLDTFRIYSGPVPCSADNPRHEDLLREDLLVEMLDCRMKFNPLTLNYESANPEGWSGVVLNSGKPTFMRFTSSECGFGIQDLTGSWLRRGGRDFVKGEIFSLGIFVIRVGHL